MQEIERIIRSIVKGNEYKADSKKKRVLHSKCLNIENQMFQVYLKSGKSNKNNFPFESLRGVLFISQSEVVKVAKLFFDFGWNPGIHVSLTRKKFEKIQYIGKSLTY